MNGALLNRVEFPRLWRYAQDSGLIVTESEWAAGRIGCFTAGNGTTTFRIPEGRSVVDRGWDDGRGIDAGRVLGDEQLDALQGHEHSVDTSDDDGIYKGRIDFGESHYGTYVTDGIVSDGVHGIPRVANETRMRNVSKLVCIKY
jgi:hypothetical protein